MSNPTSNMSVMDAIYNRRAVRSYVPWKADKATIKQLLQAAVRAPTAMHEEPWAFAVIQDPNILRHVSDMAKGLAGSDERMLHFERHGRVLGRFADPNFNVLHNAGTLVVIYCKPIGPFAFADCWLAAENFMLTACSMGLGTCVVGQAVAALNSAEIKEEIGVSATLTAVVPIILGRPNGETPLTSRQEPEIIAWK